MAFELYATITAVDSPAPGFYKGVINIAPGFGEVTGTSLKGTTLELGEKVTILQAFNLYSSPEFGFAKLSESVPSNGQYPASSRPYVQNNAPFNYLLYWILEQGNKLKVMYEPGVVKEIIYSGSTAVALKVLLRFSGDLTVLSVSEDLEPSDFRVNDGVLASYWPKDWKQIIGWWQTVGIPATPPSNSYPAWALGLGNTIIRAYVLDGVLVEQQEYELTGWPGITTSALYGSPSMSRLTLDDDYLYFHSERIISESTDNVRGCRFNTKTGDFDITEPITVLPDPSASTNSAVTCGAYIYFVKIKGTEPTTSLFIVYDWQGTNKNDVTALIENFYDTYFPGAEAIGTTGAGFDANVFTAGPYLILFDTNGVKSAFLNLNTGNSISFTHSTLTITDFGCFYVTSENAYYIRVNDRMYKTDINFNQIGNWPNNKGNFLLMNNETSDGISFGAGYGPALSGQADLGEQGFISQRGINIKDIFEAAGSTGQIFAPLRDFDYNG